MKDYKLDKLHPMFKEHIWRDGEVIDLMKTIFEIKSNVRFLKYTLLFVIGMVLAILLKI